MCNLSERLTAVAPPTDLPAPVSHLDQLRTASPRPVAVTTRAVRVHVFCCLVHFQLSQLVHCIGEDGRSRASSNVDASHLDIAHRAEEGCDVLHLEDSKAVIVAMVEHLDQSVALPQMEGVRAV